MPIQWYPGHMTKARRELAAAMPLQDVIIEVLDARIPAASSNPVVTELRRQKPCIKVLSKSDLADAPITAEWLRYLEDGGGAMDGRSGPTLAVALSTDGRVRRAHSSPSSASVCAQPRLALEKRCVR